MNRENSGHGHFLYSDRGDRSSCGRASAYYCTPDPVVNALKKLTDAPAALVERVSKYWIAVCAAAKRGRVEIPTPAVNYAGAGAVGLSWKHLEFHFEPEGADVFVRDTPDGAVTDGDLPAAESAVELIKAA